MPRDLSIEVLLGRLLQILPPLAVHPFNLGRSDVQHRLAASESILVLFGSGAEDRVFGEGELVRFEEGLRAQRGQKQVSQRFRYHPRCAGSMGTSSRAKALGC